MTNEEILRKALTKVHKNGFSVMKVLGYGCDSNGFVEGCIRILAYYNSRNNYCSLIFSHDFAKAFFGEERFKDITEEGYCFIDNDKVSLAEFKKEWGWTVYDELMKNGVVGLSSFVAAVLKTNIFIGDWRYHLQQMILEKEPLKYLEKFLNEGNYVMTIMNNHCIWIRENND